MRIAVALMGQLIAVLLVTQAIGRGLETVILELHLADAHRLAIVKLPHVGALLQRAVAQIEEEGGAAHQGGGIVSKHHPVLAGGKFVVVEHPLFGGQALQKRQIALPILDAVLPRRMALFQGKGVVGDAMLLQQDGEDLLGLLRLEDAAVVAQAKAPERRLHRQLVAGAAKTAVALGKFAHHAADPALQLAVIPEQQLAGLVQHGGHIDIRLLAGQRQSQGKGLAQALVESKACHGKALLGEGADLDGKLQPGLICHRGLLGLSPVRPEYEWTKMPCYRPPGDGLRPPGWGAEQGIEITEPAIQQTRGSIW